ncbi:MAG: S-methyl-5'-thioadenosine phosphorylase [Candidatus Kerfeldbacteria bacterium]
MTSNNEQRIGVFGGSGFYDLLDHAEERAVDTPFGSPSSPVMLGEYKGKKVAFMPRHGKTHDYPPHKVPYKANVWAMKEVGVTQIIAPSASGSLQTEMKPGDFVIVDSFVDRTKQRDETYFDGPDVAHMHCGDVYCPDLRELAAQGCKELGYSFHDRGTVVVIEGPRFSTRAESKFYTAQGWDVINMTQYPENILAAELGMCYVNVSMVTDYDVGLEQNANIKSSGIDEIMATFKDNNEKVKKLIFTMIEQLKEKPTCACSKKPDEAKI